MIDRLKNITANVILIVISTLLSGYAAIFIYIKLAATQEKPMLSAIGGNSIIQTIYMKTNAALLLKAVSDNDDKSGSIATTWDFNEGILLSKSMFVETDMYGFKKYRYLPNITVYNGRIWDGFSYRSLATRITPEIHGLINQNETQDSVYFETDENGFKKTEFSLSADSIPIFFLGDSFTEGLWVNSKDTFVNQFGKLSEAGGMPVVPVNLGVNGYSVLEEAWMLEHYAPLLKPRMVIINLFPNDVDFDTWRVITNNNPPIPEESYQKMFSYLGRIDAYCKQNNIVLVVVAVPPRWQPAEFHYFQDRLSAWSKSKNVLFLDPRRYFYTEDLDQLYLSWDPHFSALGHKHYADFLYKNIEPIIMGIHKKN